MQVKFFLCSLGLAFGVSVLGSHTPALPQTEVPYWTKAAPLSLARQELYPEVLDGKIYVVGGLLNPNTAFTAQFESYDPTQNRNARRNRLPLSRVNYFPIDQFGQPVVIYDENGDKIQGATTAVVSVLHVHG
jgi:hypothetical protein